MIQGVNALIARRGHVVRSGIARPSTVARYLRTVSALAEYHVVYWRDSQPRRVTAEGFLTLYEAGRIPEPVLLKERV